MSHDILEFTKSDGIKKMLANNEDKGNNMTRIVNMSFGYKNGGREKSLKRKW